MRKYAIYYYYYLLFFPLSIFSYHLPLNTRAFVLKCRTEVIYLLSVAWLLFLFIYYAAVYTLHYTHILMGKRLCLLRPLMLVREMVEKKETTQNENIYLFYLYISLYLPYYWSGSDTSFIIVINNEGDDGITKLACDVREVRGDVNCVLSCGT